MYSKVSDGARGVTVKKPDRICNMSSRCAEEYCIAQGRGYNVFWRSTHLQACSQFIPLLQMFMANVEVRVFLPCVDFTITRTQNNAILREFGRMATESYQFMLIEFAAVTETETACL